jgi:hypothetical protein
LIAASFCAYAAIGLGEGYGLGVEPLLAALAGIGLAGLLKKKERAEPGALKAALPAGALLALSVLLCLVMIPFDAFAASRAGKPACRPAGAPLEAFLDDGIRLAGNGWYLARWAGVLKARPDVCAGMSAFAAGDAAEAARRFDKAAALAPLDPEIRISLAVALAGAGQKARARREAAAAEALAGTVHASGHADRLLASIRSTRAGLEKP